MEWDDVVELGLELPEVEVSSSYGTPALKVRKKLFARLLETGETLVLLKIDDIERQMLLETQPDVFYLTPHYVGWPTVLVRLPNISREQLRELLTQSWERVAPASVRKLRYS